MTNIDSGFIGWFKTGDNINYNLSILNKLYFCYDQDKDILLLKPIIILIISIIEALLVDHMFKIKAFNREGVRNIDEKKLEKISKKEYKKFETLISGSKKFELLGSDENLYESLTYLRKIRNHIHIQESSYKDEIFVFTAKEKTKAENICKTIFKYLSENHKRADNLKYVADFILPR